MMFQKAIRSQTPLKVCITGPSGSGKTMSALEMACGIGGKIALVDTENRSASLYSDRYDFDSAAIDPPYTVEKYLECIKGAEEAGYSVLIIDSGTHAWAGEGGLLEQKTAKDRQGGNSFTNWAEMTPKHNRFVAAILQSPLHIICTLRSKTEYVVEQNDKGKSAPRKVGMAPIQRDGLDYEFTVVFDMDLQHTATATKDRTSLFQSEVFTPNRETGQRLIKWQQDGEPIALKWGGISDDELEGHIKDLEDAFERGEGGDWWVSNAKPILSNCTPEQKARFTERKDELKEYYAPKPEVVETSPSDDVQPEDAAPLGDPEPSSEGPLVQPGRKITLDQVDTDIASAKALGVFGFRRWWDHNKEEYENNATAKQWAVIQGKIDKALDSFGTGL